MSAPFDQMMDRRGFFRTAALGTAGMVAIAAGMPSLALAEEDVTFDEDCDVLVVGTGYAGLAASYEAANAGAKVKLIEKLAAIGGNSMIADGDFAVCGSEGQKALGIEDSVDTFVHDMQVAGLFLNDVEKCRIIAEKSNETFKWTQDFLGVEFQTSDKTGLPEPIPYGGHSVLRTMHPVACSGSAYVIPLYDKVEEAGVDISLETMLSRIIKNSDGRVVGAEVKVGAKDGDIDSGEPYYIKATRGVVLASGGFGQDVKWRKMHDPRLDESVDCTNCAGATAETLCTAMDSGALAVHLDWIQCGPWCSPDEKGYGVSATWIDSAAPYAPSINPDTGQRCVNELTDRKRYCDAIFEVGKPLVQIANNDMRRDLGNKSLDLALERGVTLQFDTLEEVADHYGLPKEAFMKQMEEYNTYVANKNDEQFGKPIPDDAVPVENPPFYITRLWPKVHHCMGGVKTDADCRVIDVHLNVIDGLYAAGEVTGGIHGACRLGSCATADCLVNGRIAGRNAAAADPIA